MIAPPRQLEISRAARGANRKSAGVPVFPAGSRSAFTLIELAVAVVLLAIVASILIQRSDSGLVGRLEAAGSVVASDLAYVRGLAVAHGTTYEITWNSAADTYQVERITGTGSRVAVPPPVFLSSPDPNRFIEELEALPSGPCELVGVETVTAPRQVLTSIRFGPTGVADPPQAIRIWLATGQGSSRLYLPVTIAHPTGIASVGEVRRKKPTLAGFSASALN